MRVKLSPARMNAARIAVTADEGGLARNGLICLSI